MKNKKLLKTHKHLTRIFTGVVFVIVLIVGFSFITAKYFSEDRDQKKEVSAQIKNISTGIKTDTNYLTKYSRQKIVEEVRKFRPWDIRWNRENNIEKISFLVLDEENNLIFKEILQEPWFEKIDFDAKWIYKDEETFMYTETIWDKKVIFYQKIRYSSWDVFSDILLLLFLATLLSGLVYFIWYRFVDSALRPVEENMKDMSDFIHNAGHELKTPLAVIRGNLQVMQVEEKFDKKLLKKSIREIDTTNTLIEWLRELSEVGKLSDKEHLALGVEVKRIEQELQSLAVEKKVHIHNTVEWPFIVVANPWELHIVIMNIMKNAILYNIKWWKIDVKLDKNILTISDSGVGMNTEEQEKIFERLYRGSNIRSEEWFGIGLSLVKKIVDANGWKISVESTLWEGSKFQIVF